jgi:probable F420-dependent oxidoreductase
MFDELGSFGVFRRNVQLTPDLAAAVEQLGFRALWVGGSPPGDLRQIEETLEATKDLIVATGIVNIWTAEPQPVAASYHRLEAKFPGRFILGLGAGHPEAIGGRYAKPYTALVAYLDELDAAGVPVARRALAALGPRVLKLSADRTAGAHPYLVTAEHTKRAREIIGPDALLAPEQKVVLSEDAATARATARPTVVPYLKLTNYASNLRTLGFDDDDFAGEGSDRVVDAVTVYGSDAAIRAGVRAHLDAGANHVPVNLLTAPDEDPIEGFTRLAAILLGPGA